MKKSVLSFKGKTTPQRWLSYF